MPYYNDLRPESDPGKKSFAQVFQDWAPADRKRTIQNLLRLRQGLTSQCSTRKADGNLLVCSWNIKEFGHTTQRLPESYFYMAEIMSRFDLIAIQEIKSGLEDLNILMKLLGEDWAYVINDITEGTEGNSERSAYIFDKNRVAFAGLAGEILLWDDLTLGSPVKQLKRTPYMTGFQAGWKTFAMVNLHLHPGESDTEQDNDFAYRKEEARLLLAALKEKSTRGRLWNENLVLCGDFNLYNPTSTKTRDAATIALFSAEGYREVDSLIGAKTNASKTEAYDRFFLSRGDYFKVARKTDGKENGGVIDVFSEVFRDGEDNIYKSVMMAQYTGSADLNDPLKLKKYFRHPWRKNQMSDHFPIWFELITDSSDDFLRERLGEYH